MKVTEADRRRASLLLRRWGRGRLEALLSYALASERARAAVVLERLADEGLAGRHPRAVVLALRDASDLLRGRLDAQGSPGRSPRRAARAQQEAPDSPGRGGSPGACWRIGTGEAPRRRLLLVDDDAGVLEVVSKLLVEHEVATVLVTGPDAVVACARSAREQGPDVVFVDRHMPVDAAVVIAAVRRAHPPARVILFSGDSLGEPEASRVGADAFLDKCCSPDQLLATAEGRDRAPRR